MASKPIEAEWTEEWPTDRGWYWCNHIRAGLPLPFQVWCLMPVHVRSGYCVARGRLFRREDVLQAHWMPMVVPTPKFEGDHG